MLYSAYLANAVVGGIPVVREVWRCLGNHGIHLSRHNFSIDYTNVAGGYGLVQILGI